MEQFKTYESFVNDKDEVNEMAEFSGQLLRAEKTLQMLEVVMTKYRTNPDAVREWIKDRNPFSYAMAKEWTDKISRL